jgi:hypothetical protein
MSLLSGLDDFWLDVSYHSLRFRRKAYNITSLPEQFEVFHDYHQHDSQRPTGRMVSMVSSPVGGKARAMQDAKMGDSKRRERLTFLRPVLGVQDR